MVSCFEAPSELKHILKKIPRNHFHMSLKIKDFIQFIINTYHYLKEHHLPVNKSKSETKKNRRFLMKYLDTYHG